VDDPKRLGGLIEALAGLSKDLAMVFAVHPRTKATIEVHGLSRMLQTGRILVTPPLSYLRAIGLMQAARVAITDSGGVQEETTALGVPCLTVRENTERPITIEEGTNVLVGTAPSALEAGVRTVLATGGKRGRVPECWDGRAAERIAAHIDDYLDKSG
jgi:UDP-N-acetylglucosamine 2-epimerase (non-hydrolysing)